MTKIVRTILVKMVMEVTIGENMTLEGGTWERREVIEFDNWVG